VLGSLIDSPELRDFGPLLLVVSLGLGLLVGGRQFALPGFLKTWALTIHRSLSGGAILLGKLSAAAIALGSSIGLIWTLMFF